MPKIRTFIVYMTFSYCQRGLCPCISHVFQHLLSPQEAFTTQLACSLQMIFASASTIQAPFPGTASCAFATNWPNWHLDFLILLSCSMQFSSPNWHSCWKPTLASCRARPLCKINVGNNRICWLGWQLDKVPQKSQNSARSLKITRLVTEHIRVFALSARWKPDI